MNRKNGRGKREKIFGDFPVSRKDKDQSERGKVRWVYERQKKIIQSCLSGTESRRRDLSLIHIYSDHKSVFIKYRKRKQVVFSE